MFLTEESGGKWGLKSELWLVKAEQSRYIAGALIGQNLLPDWRQVLLYKYTENGLQYKQTVVKLIQA